MPAGLGTSGNMEAGRTADAAPDRNGYPVRLPAALATAAENAAETEELTGLVGWIIDVIDAFGPVGVAAMVAIENIFPPIPSEVVLPFAGFSLGREGSGLVGMILAATVGGVVGAIVLYEAGRAIGLRRTRALLARLPLVEVEEVDLAVAWFERHGSASVLLGRCVPLVRSLVSLPAGAACMPRGRFLALTTLGTVVWNTVWVSAGYLLGAQWERAAEYSDLLNLLLVLAVVAVVAHYVWTRRDRISLRRR